MTEQQITNLGPAFSTYLSQFRDSFEQDRTARHFDTYCRGLLSDLPRKSVEPIALAAGTAVRTLQEFLVTAVWDNTFARDTFQGHIRDVIAQLPADPLGTIGVIDETSSRKWGEHTPGVQRQYLGCVGKIDNGIVTVHIGVAKGRFQTLLDADLFLPKSWSDDRPRCRAAGIPDNVKHRTKWRLALDQWLRFERQRGVVRLARVRRGLWGSGSVPEVLERGEPTVRGRSAGELRGATEGGRAVATCGHAVDGSRCPQWEATPTGSPNGPSVILACGHGDGVGGGSGTDTGSGRGRIHG